MFERLISNLPPDAWSYARIRAHAGVAELADARDLKSDQRGLLKSLMTWAIPHQSYMKAYSAIHFRSSYSVASHASLSAFLTPI
jgi:hypothetical protein